MFGRIIFLVLCALLFAGPASGVHARGAEAPRVGLRVPGTPRFETRSAWTNVDHSARTVSFHAQAREGQEVPDAARGSRPWYAAGLAVFLYVLLGLGVFAASGWLAARRQRRQFEANRRELEHEVEMRTRELDAQKKMLQHLNATLRTSNERLQELSEQKSRLLGIAAHDLKAPLTSIYSLADILLEEQGSGEPNYEFIELIQRTARDMSLLIENVLTSTAAETGQVGLHCVPTDLGTLAERAVEQCVGMAERKGQRLLFNMHPPEGDFGVIGDELRLVEAMTNLVSNAVKYSPLEGTITVEIVRNEDHAYFFVKDCGPGLTEEDRELLFQPFQRLSAQPTSGESSSGMGLYIVRQYIEMHGGIVGVESTPGAGSTFWICLPAVTENVMPVASPSGDGSGNRG